MNAYITKKSLINDLRLSDCENAVRFLFKARVWGLISVFKFDNYVTVYVYYVYFLPCPPL